MTKKQPLLIAVILIALTGVFAASFLGEQRTRSHRDPAMDGWKEYTIYWFDVFDTVTRVVGYAPSQEEWTAQTTALHEDLLAYHRLYDIYNSYEGITSLADVNSRAGLEPVTVDRRTLNLLQLSRQLYDTTNGQLNIAMGSVLSLWHDAREAGLSAPDKAALPSPQALKDASAHTNIKDMILDEQASTVYFADPELKLDVGSVGKGYAVEQAAQAALERGLTSAFISVGGNLRAIGHKPDNTDWNGGIQDPQNPEATLCSLTVPDGFSLVTSGNYQRYFTVDGVRYCHLIDPDTLYPADFFNGVSVLASDSGLADCLSTGLFCMTLEEGQALIESLADVDACWQLPDGNVVYSPGFEARITSQKGS